MNSSFNPPPPVTTGSPVLKWFRSKLKRPITALLLACFTLWSVHSGEAATNTWTADSEGDFSWSTSSNWGSLAAPISTDDLIFPGSIPNPGMLLANPQIITLGAGSLANSLTFKNSYTLSSGDLTLTAGSGGIISTDLGSSATIGSQLLGTAGLTKTGNGTLTLSNGGNNYTGLTQITRGSLVITSGTGLGSDSPTVSILGNRNGGASSAAPGFGGGQLTLGAGVGLGTSPSGMTFARNLAVSGGGNSGDGFAFNSVGNNTLSGIIYSSAGGAARLGSTFGTTTISGTLALQGNTSTELRGFGSWNLTGALTGSTASVLSKAGEQGTLIFNPSNSTEFAGAVTVVVGSVRVASGTSLGISGADNAIRLSGGTLEIRSDAASTFGTVANPNRATVTANTTVFVDRAVGSLDATKLNQTINLGLTTANTASNTFTVNGRNGTNLTLADYTASGAFTFAVTNSSNGTFTINGGSNNRIYDHSDSTARTFTLNATGDIVLNAGIAGSGAAHVVTKAGSGNLTWAAPATTTSTGGINVNAGTVTVSGTATALSNAIGASPGITFGNAAVGAALNYTGTGETSAKVLIFSGTTGPTFIFANQSTATAPLVLSNFNSIYGAGAKTIVLGGKDTQANAISSVIGENSGTNTTSILKTGAGNWTLSNTNTYTGTTTINNGTLIIGGSGTVLTDASAIIFNADGATAASGHLGTQSAGGTFRMSGTGSTENVGALTASAGNGRVATTGTGTLKFASLGTRASGATLNFAPATGAGIQFGTTAPTGLNGQVGGFAYITNPTTGAIDFIATPLLNANVAALGAGTALPTLTGSATTNYVNTASIGPFTGNVAASTLRIVGTGQTINRAGFNLVITNTSATAIGGILLDNTGGGATISGTGGSILGTIAANELIFTVGSTAVQTAANGLNITGVISGAATGLTKAGSGFLNLSGTNTFTGNVVINEGTIQLSGTAPTQLGAITVAGNTTVIRQGATLDLNGAGPSATTTSGTLVGAGSVTSAGAATLNIGTLGITTSTGTFSGVIGGAVSIVKNGTGTQTLIGANTYSGSTRINAGTLSINDLGALGTSTSSAANLVFGGGTLQYTGSNAVFVQATQTPSVSTAREFTLAGNATIDSSGTYGNSFLATGVANNAALVFTSTADLTFSGTGGRSLTLTGSSTGDNTMSIRLRDNPNAGEALSLTKSGAGLWILNPSSSNTYSGATTVNGSAATTAGVLQFADDSGEVKGISTGSNIVLGAATGPGVLQSSGSFIRASGTGANQVQIGTSGGGFAASSSKLTVNLGSAGASLAFGASPFNTSLLVLNSTTALAEVELVNGLDLGASNRTIQVNDNTSTGTDLATISGAISGTAGGNLLKTGTGILQLVGANAYAGNTVVQAGTLVVNSFGNATAGNGPVTTTSSLGNNNGELQLGNTTTAGVVNYVGAGEVSNRVVSLNGTTGGGTITSDGYGPLVLTSNLNIGTAGIKGLTLQGYNSNVNEFRGAITDSGSTISVTKAQGGTWILSNSGNTFTGGVTISGGLLGVADNAALGTGTLTFSNGGLFAVGGDRTFANALTSGGDNNFTGDHSITFNTGTSIISSGGNRTIRNTIASGEALTLAATINIGNSGGTGRTATFSGPGTTILSGPIIDGTSVASNITVNALSGNVQFNNGTSTYSGTTTLTSGTVTVGSTGTPFGTGTLAFNSAELTASTPVVLSNPTTTGTTTGLGARLTGTNSMEFTGLFGNTAATTVVTNQLSGGATLTLGQLMMNTAGDTTSRTMTLNGTGNTILNGSIQATAGTLNNLTYSNSGTLSINTINSNGGSGTFSINNGTVSLAAAAQTPLNFAAIQLNGGTLNVNNQTNGNVANRLGTATALNFNGGTFAFTANTAAGSSENFGGAMGVGAGAGTGGGASTLTFNNAGTAASTLTFTTLTPNQGGTLNLNGTAVLGATNKITFSALAPTLSPVSTGILARVTVGGTDFATYDAGSATLSGFSAYNNSNDLDTAAATDTMNITVSPAFAGLSGILPVLSRTVNGIKLDGDGIAIASVQPNTTLTVTSGGLIATGATATGATISVPVLAFGSSEAVAHIDSNSGLATTISSALTGSGGLTKAGNGILTLSGQLAYTGQTTVNAGTLNLNSAIGTLPTATSRTLSNLAVNEGATLNLGVNSAGNIQAFGSIQSSDPLSGKGGIINNSAASTVNLISATATATTFGGSITDTGGDLSFFKQGNSTTILTGASTYAGSTNLYGGGLTLRDGGTLASTTINVNGGTLLLDNAGLSTVSQRIPTAASVNLRGGTLQYTGGNNVVEVGSIATTGGAAVNAVMGANIITATIGTAANTDLVIGNLTRTAGQGTVNFTGSGTLGANGQANGRITLNQINGVAPTDGQFIGAWAIVNGADYATYFNGNGTTSNGVGAYDAAGFNTYTTFAPIATAGTYQVPTGILESGNISNLVAGIDGTIFTLPNVALNQTDALRLGTNSTDVRFNNAAHVLNLRLGGLLRTGNDTAVIGTTTTRGVLTAGLASGSGVTELIAFINQNTTTIHSAIVDTSNGATGLGGTGTVSLVKSGPGTLTLTGTNTYTGGTTVQQGTLTLSSTTANGTTIVAVPGNLTINNGATVNFGVATANSQISDTSNITINGAGTLTLPNYGVTHTNTWSSLTFNNNAGSAALVPTVGFGTPTFLSTIDLAGVNAITVTNDNFASTPLIAASSTANLSQLRFTNTTGATVINVGGMAPEGLQITAPITSVSSTSGLEKTGVGGLILSGANTYNNSAGLKLVDGSLILSNAAALGANTSPLVIGDTSVANTVPLTVMVGATAYTGTNAVTVNRDFTFGGLTSANDLTFAGAVTLAGTGARTITVTSPAVTGTISGTIGGSVGLSKDGIGTLVLGSTANSNDYTGATTVSAGAMRINVAEQIPDASALTVASGALLNLNGFNETVGSLAGAGLILNTGEAMTLSAGGDNTSTTFSGIISNSPGSVLNFVKTGSGVQTLSAVNTYSGSTTITNGSLRIGISQALPNGLTGNSVAFNPASGTATLDLNGFSQTIGALTSSGAGTSAIDNTAAGVASVTIGALDQAVSFGGNITQSGGGAVAVTKVGTNTATLSGATINYTGLTTVSGGTLNFTNAIAPGLTGGVSVAGGATLNLNNTAGDIINMGANGINLGTGVGTTILGFDLGAGDASAALSINDSLNTTGTANITNTIQFNLTGLGGFSAGTFNLLTASSGLLTGGATYTIGTAPSGYNFSFNNTDSIIQLIATLQQDRFWKGLADNSWSTINSGSDYNWSNSADGSTDFNAVPSGSDTVSFGADNAAVSGGGAITTTLDGNISIGNLKFLDGTNTTPDTTSTTIAPGTSGTLTLTPSSSSDGILVNANSGTILISAPVALGSSQTWSVSNTSASLEVSGVISGAGAASLTKAETGTLTLSGTGANTYAGNTTVNAGTVILNKSASTDAIAAGTLTVGDSVGGNDADIVQLSAAGQINDAVNVDVRSSGLLNLNGNNETIAALTLQSDVAEGASVTTGAGVLSLGGSVTLNANGTGVTGADITGSLNLNDAARTFTIAKGSGNTTADLNVNGAISSTTAASGSIVKDGAGTLAFTGAANTYNGNTTVNAGVLALAKAASTDSIAGGTLIIGDSLGGNNADIAILTEAEQINNSASVDVRSSGLFSLNGFAETIAALTLESDAAFGASVTTGAATLTIGGNVTLNANGTGATGADITGSLNLNDAARTFTVALGSGNITQDLDIDGAISSTTLASGSLVKDGLGTLRFTGAANTFTGGVTVNAGTLLLSKAASTDAIAGGTLVIGDSLGGNVADIVRLTATEQINNSVNVDVRSSGLFSLNGFAETIAGLTLQSDDTSGASVTTGAGSLLLGGNVTLNSLNNGTVGADINGAVNLNNGTRTFTVADGDAAVDLDVSGVISSTTAASGLITKAGTGTLRFTGAGANTYSGLTTVNAGTLLLSKAAGTNAVAGALTIGDGTGGNDADVVRTTANEQIGNTTITINRTGFLDMTGNVETFGALAMQTGATEAASLVATQIILTANVSTTADSTGVVGADIVSNINLNTSTTADATRTFNIAKGSGNTTFDLDIDGAISSTTPARGLVTKTGTGTLRFSGATSNTYTGLTQVTGGTLQLNKSDTAVAIAGGLTIGGANNTAATVQYTGASTNMIATINPSILGRGILDFNGATDTIGDVTITNTGATTTNPTPIINTAGGGNLTIGALTITPVAGLISVIDSGSGGGTITLGGSVTFTPATTGRAQITGDTLALGANRTFTIGLGTGSTYDLDISSAITGGGFTVGHAAGGRLQLSGSTSNTYSGNTTVTAGSTLLLNKSGTANAMGAGLIVGAANNVAATAKYTGDSSDMLTGNISVLGRGTLDINGKTDTIGNLTVTASGATGGTTPLINTAGGGNLTIGTLNITPVAGGDSVLNVGATGTLTLGGTATFTAATTGRAQFLGGTLALGGNRIVTVGLGSGTTYDLELQAAITGSTETLDKQGTGRLMFSGSAANSYSGLTTVTGGTLLLNKTATVDAIAGDVTIGGGVLRWLASDQINDTSTVTYNSGSFDFTGGFSETIGALTINATPTFTGNSSAMLLTVSGATNLTAGTTSHNSGTVWSTGSLSLTGTAAWTSLGNSTTTQSNYTIGAGGISMSGQTITLNSGAGATGLGSRITLNGNFTGTGTNTITNSTATNGAAQIDLGGAVRTFDITGTTTIQNNGNLVRIQNGGITKTGTGTLILGGANTYAEATTVNNGVLRYNNNDAIHSSGAVTVNANGAELTATLDLNGFNGTLSSLTLGGVGQTATSSAIVQTGAGTLTLNGGLNYNATGNPGTAALVTGQLALPATRTFTVADSSGSLVDLDVQAVVSGAGGINKAGPGALLLSGTNTYSGKTTITNGALAITVVSSTPGANQSLGTHSDVDLGVAGTSSGTLVYAAPGAGALGKNINALGNGSDTILNLGGALTLSGTLTKNGTTLTLSGSSSGILVTGTIVGSSSGSDLVIGGGVVTLSNANPYNGPTFLSAGATLNINNANAISDGALNIDGGTIDNTSGAAITLATNNPLNINNDFTFTGSNSLNLGTGAVTLNASRTVTASANTLTIGGAISGTGGITKQGAGALLLSGTNTYSGKTTITNGALTITVVSSTPGANQSLGTHSDVDLGVAGTSSGTLVYAGAGAGTLGKNINALGNGSDTIQNLGAGLLTLSGTVTKDGTTLTLSGGSSGIVVTGTIAGTSAGSDLVIGAGVTTLASENTYNGPTILNSGGTLNINHTNAISSGALTINGGTIDNTSGAAITLATNNPLNINSDFTFTGSNSLNLGTGEVTLTANRTVTVSANTLTIGGVITGGFSLVGAGNGTLTLTGASDYTGTTTAQPGTTLNVGDGSLGDTFSGTTVESGASLVLNGVTYTAPEPLTISGTGAGGVGGAFATTGTSSFAGPITAASNATISASETLSLTGGLVKNGTTLTLAGGGTITISGTGISGANANSDLVVDGTTVNLNVASSYNGPTSILNGGVINANVADALPTSNGRTAVTMDASGSGSSNLTLGASQAIASLTGAASSTVNLNDNTLTIGTASGSTTFAGIISGTDGALVKDGASTLVLSGSNSYTGGTTVSAGTLLVNNTTGSGTGTGTINVNNGSTLGGSGAVSGLVVVGDGVGTSRLAPGNSIGQLTVGSLDVNASGVIDFELGSAPTLNDSSAILAYVYGGTITTTIADSWASTTYNNATHDQLRITTLGSPTIDGSINLSFSSGYDWTYVSFGDVFHLIDWNGQLTGEGAEGLIGTQGFEGIDLSAESGGTLAWDTSLFSSYGIVFVVPEPSRAMLLLLGLLVLGFRRRREGV